MKAFFERPQTSFHGGLDPHEVDELGPAQGKGEHGARGAHLDRRHAARDVPLQGLGGAREQGGELLRPMTHATLSARTSEEGCA